jgi:hypothetical protein
MVGISINRLAPSVGTFVVLAKYICTSGMVTTRSEALRGPWGNWARKHPEKGETSSKSSPTLEILTERIARMEKEMHELEEKNAALQRRHAKDSHSATLQPDEKESGMMKHKPEVKEVRKKRRRIMIL